MSNQYIKTIICIILCISAAIAITFFVTKNHYENDSNTIYLNKTHIYPSTTYNYTNIILPQPYQSDQVSQLNINTQTNITDKTNIDIYIPNTSFEIYIDNLPKCNVPNNNKMLIVYDSDDDDDFDYLSELYAVVSHNLISRFRKSDVIHIKNYNSICGYDSVMYIGYSFKTNQNMEQFITDIMSNLNNIPVLWLGNNIWEMVNTTTENYFGFRYIQRRSDMHQIYYKGEWVSRNIRNGQINEVQIFNHHKTQMLSYSFLESKNIPWAIRSNRNFMYICEIPFSYINHNDRFIVFTDLLFEFFNIYTNRQRALVRLEDIGPNYNIENFLNSVNYLKSTNTPFSFGVFPIYINGLITIRLSDRPLMIDAIKYAMDVGGELIFHGITHQYENISNPYRGESGSDFEFFLKHIDPITQSVIYDSPVPNDSREWVENRLEEGIEEFRISGIELPNIFEFPHYVGSDLDYRIIAENYPIRYDRGMYYTGSLNQTTIDYSHMIGHFSPFVIRDIYGSIVIPENMGNFIRISANNNVNRDAIDLVNTARFNKNIMRDSIASFFYHPFLGIDSLQEIVSGIKELGYTFVSTDEILNDFNL